MPGRARTNRVVLLGAIGLFLLLSGASSRPAAAADLVEALEALRAEEDAERRIALIPRLARVGGDRAAIALGRLVRKDPDVRVRLAAVRGLTEIEAANLRTVLMAEIRHGGPLQVREALAHALRRRDLGDALLKVIDWPRTPLLERALCVSALGAFTDTETGEVLRRLLRSQAPDIRVTAVRALARRADAGSKRLRLFVELLVRGGDRGVTLAALDVVAPFVHPVMRSALERLARDPDEDIASAAVHVLRSLERTEAEAAKARAKASKQGAKKDKDGRYAEPAGGGSVPGKPGDSTRTPGGERVPRPRLDLVWVLDATGSATATLGRTKARILLQMDSRSHAGQSTRVGIVVFRGGHFDRDQRRGLSVLPLTAECERVEAFLRDVRSRGVDDRGSAVPRALHVALDQMGWRRNAHREVRLQADGGVRKPRAAKATVSMHYRAEKTRTFVTFMRRTRTVVPPELGDLAALGGGELKVLR